MSLTVRFCRWAVCLGLFVSFAAVTSPAAAQGTNAEADNLFRSLDANGDGHLTMDEVRQNNRQMLGQIFQMAGKDGSEAVSRAEFQQVFDRVRGGGSERPNPPASQTPQTSTPAETPAVSDSPLSGLLIQLDANGDGKLTRTEWGRLGSLFSKRDLDKNASLEGDELRGQGDDIDLTQLAARLDSNGDGKLTRSEWSRLSQLFAQLDTDHKGTLDAAKLDAKPSEGDTGPGRYARSSRSGSTSRPDTGPSVWRGWLVMGRGDNPNAGQMEMELTIAGNRIVGRELGTRRAPQGLGSGVFVMNGDGRTGTLDATQQEGPNQGRVYLGIYQIEGDVLRWCVSNREGQRPQDFATTGGTYLMVLRRQAGS